MQLGRNRVEALADGVFAVAMTLLVLDWLTIRDTLRRNTRR
jgi:uncharacterized membrane protein